MVLRYTRIKWQSALKDLEKTSYVSYQCLTMFDVLGKFDNVWGLKFLVLSPSKLVTNWKDRPTRMKIIY